MVTHYISSYVFLSCEHNVTYETKIFIPGLEGIGPKRWVVKTDSWLPLGLSLRYIWALYNLPRVVLKKCRNPPTQPQRAVANESTNRRPQPSRCGGCGT